MRHEGFENINGARKLARSLGLDHVHQHEDGLWYAGDAHENLDLDANGVDADHADHNEVIEDIQEDIDKLEDALEDLQEDLEEVQEDLNDSGDAPRIFGD